MSLNSKSMSVGGAMVFLALSAGGAFAQSPPTSQKRIPITKEAAGEVVRVDTVLKTDTLRVTSTVYHTDTLVKTLVRVDSVMLEPPHVPVKLPNGLYLGLAGGSSAPDGSIYIPNGAGYIGQMQLGWQHAKQFLGARISGTYTGLGQDSQFSNGTSARLWTFSTDGKLNLPLGHVFGFSPRLNAYGIGGWTYTWFKDLPRRLDTNDNLPSVILAGDDSWTGRNGWDAGGGLSLNFNRSEIFVESRVMGFSVSSSPQARQIPIVLGFNWY